MSKEFLNETIRLASNELQSRFGTKLSISEKKDASLVTDADLASERIIIERIKKYFPDDIIISEESGLSSTKRVEGQYVWIIDPLDGTTNFANAYPFYCVSIGRGRFGADGKITIELGGIAEPCRDRVFLAEKGKGAYLNGDRRLNVAASRELSKAFLVTGFYYSRGNELQLEIDRFSRVAEQCSSIRRDGAAALDLAYVAEGVFDLFWEKGLAIWDVAAGSLIVQEAGGVVSNYPSNQRREDFYLENVGIIAGSPAIVDAVCALF